MILSSRQKFSSSEDFRDKFLQSITPGVIKRADFIHWDTIVSKTKKYNVLLSFFENVNQGSDAECVTQLRDGLLAADEPIGIIKTAFELLGHTGKTYVSDKDSINFQSLGEQEQSEELMEYISTLLVELGIRNILSTEIRDYFTGVQVGLETHRRKNVGGSAFIAVVASELLKMVQNFKKKGYDIELTSEEEIYFIDKTTAKTVDFCLKYNGKAIGMEVNFYTASGSKPTEIKRSYGHVNGELGKLGVALAWITDGIGYESMKKSLKEARDIHKNIYNFNMMKESFESDIASFFGIS